MISSKPLHYIDIEELSSIMTDSAAEAKLKFLLVSGHLYSATAPATSAQLMLQRHIEIAGSARPKSSDGSSSTCKACGTVLVPGWTSQIGRVDKGASRTTGLKPKSRNHARGKPLLIPEKYVRVKCLACHRFEDTPLQKPKSGSQSKTAKATMSSADAKLDSDPRSIPLDTPTKASKRRERTRKHKSGLQAMLEKSKTPAVPSSGLGLDLLDLMKQD